MDIRCEFPWLSISSQSLGAITQALCTSLLHRNTVLKLNSLHWLFSHPSQASPAPGWWILFNFSPLHWQSLPLCCSLPCFWKHLQFTFSQFSRSVVSDSLPPHGLWQARPPCPSPTLRVYSNSCSLSRWCHPTISPSVVPSPHALNLSQHQGLFPWVGSSHQVAKVLELQFQHQSFQCTSRTDFL